MVMCKGCNTESRVFTTLSRELAASMVFSACSNSTAPMAASPTQVWPTQAVQHLIEGNQDASIYRWLGPQWNWLLIEEVEKQVADLIAIYLYLKHSGSSRRSSHLQRRTNTGIDQVTWKHSLTVIPQSPNEYKKLITKLDNHFIPMVNPDCALSKLEKMCQNEGESIARYHIR